MTIEKPINYIRDFKGGILNNGIKYTIINDKNIDYSCVACCVGVGSKEDPRDFQGLAHFLEHMLFLGSKKYPDAGYFNEYITKNGGFSNAYTSFFETNYYYKINNDSLEESIDIFSRFFIDPLFDKNFIDREINAIESEHSKNINDDFWLFRQIIFNLAKPDSDINTFSTGNIETLKKDNLRNEMIEFFEKYYTSDNISITILSSFNIDKIEKLVISIFNQIKKTKNNITIKNEIKYDIKNKEYQLFPINGNDDCKIIYFFDINYNQYYKLDKTIEIIDQIINDFNEDGINHYLKSNGYIHSLHGFINDEGVYFIVIDINKEKGDIKNTIKFINGKIKNFLNNLLNYDLNKIYDYHIKKYDINYNYGGKEDGIDLVQEVCVNMLNYDIQNFYNGNKIVLQKKLEKFTETIKKINFTNANILYYYNKDLGIDKKLRDKYYNATYGNLKETFIVNENDIIKFKIVDSNKYYSIKPSFNYNLDKYEIPTLYEKRKWYGAVSRYNEYSVIGKLVFSNNSLFNDIENYISTLISIKIINYYLTLKYSNVMDIGFVASFGFNSKMSAIILSIFGLNDKYNEFFNDVIKYIPTIKPTEDIIDNNILSVINHYDNIKTLGPWRYFNYILELITNKNYYSHDAILESLKNKNYTNIVQKRINNIIKFNNLSLYSIFYGNINFSNLPNTNIFLKNYNYERVKLQPLNLIRSNNFKKLNPNEKNNMVVYSFFCCDFNPNKIVKLFVLYNILENEAYTELRTKQQLGYHVGANITVMLNNYYLLLKVQSENEIDFIKDKMNNFIDYFKSYFIKLMSNEENLQKIKKSVYNTINIESNNTNELFSKYFYEILINRYFFNENIILSNELNKINVKDMIDFVNYIFENKEIIVIN